MMQSYRSRGMALADYPMAAAIAEVEAMLDYRFRNPELVAEALTHSSDSEHQSYQRLEFIGDAALGCAFSNFLYIRNPDLGPGRLSTLRAANISTEKLARVAVKHRLYRLLRRNSPKLDEMVEEFTLVVEREMIEEFDGLPYGGSTVKAPKVLADIVEAIAAAVYVDCNFDLESLWRVFRGMLEPIITTENLDVQPVTTLYEHCQKKGKSLLFKRWRKGTVIVVNAFVDGQMLGIGSSEDQRTAKLNASRDALQKLYSLDPVEVVMDEVGEENSKHRLNEICSKRKFPKPVYRIEKEDGPPHDKKFICSVRIVTPSNEYSAVGAVKSRVKDAENSAASKILNKYFE